MFTWLACCVKGCVILLYGPLLGTSAWIMAWQGGSGPVGLMLEIGMMKRRHLQNRHCTIIPFLLYTLGF